MSARPTQPGKSEQTLLIPSANAPESDTASDCVGSDADCGIQPNITRRLKRKFDDSALSEIKDMLLDVQLQQKNQTIKFEEEMKRMTQQNSEIIQSIQHMSDKYDDVLSKLQQTKEENTVLKIHIKKMEQKIDLLERNSKASSLELRNVPESQSESKAALINIVKNVGDVLNVEVLDKDIRNIYRPKKTQNKSTPIIVEFSTNYLKETIISASKTFNKNNKTNKLNTTHLKISGESKPIFIAESLTTYGKYLYYLAREYVKNTKDASCWTSYGKVYIRQREGGQSMLIAKEEDVVRLTSQ